MDKLVRTLAQAQLDSTPKVTCLQLHGLHERMANLGSLATASGSLREQAQQLRTDFQDNPTRTFPLPLSVPHACM